MVRKGQFGHLHSGWDSERGRVAVRNDLQLVLTRIDALILSEPDFLNSSDISMVQTSKQAGGVCVLA